MTKTGNVASFQGNLSPTVEEARNTTEKKVQNFVNESSIFDYIKNIYNYLSDFLILALKDRVSSFGKIIRTVLYFSFFLFVALMLITFYFTIQFSKYLMIGLSIGSATLLFYWGYLLIDKIFEIFSEEKGQTIEKSNLREYNDEPKSAVSTPRPEDTPQTPSVYLSPYPSPPPTSDFDTIDRLALDELIEKKSPGSPTFPNSYCSAETSSDSGNLENGGRRFSSSPKRIDFNNYSEFIKQEFGNDNGSTENR